METLAESASQTPAEKEERSRVSGPDLGENGVNLASEGLAEKSVEGSVKVADKSVGEVSKMSGKRGRKKRVLGKLGDEEKVDAGVGKTSNGGDLEGRSSRKWGRRGGVKENGEGAPGNAENIDEDNKEVDDEEEDEKGRMGEEHDFSVGDLVWGKIKSHPWWPGQIYRPSDASEAATKYKRKNRLLVAYFGDGTFAWCYPSQLKPFQENFGELANQSNMKSFTKAVEAAVNEIGRCLDLEMSCCCVPVGDKPDKPLAMNAGIIEGVAVPGTRLGGLSILQCSPANFLAHLKFIAHVVSINNMLDLLVLRHRLTAFYRAKGYRQLPVYHEPMEISRPDDMAVNELSHRGDGEAHTENIAKGQVMDDNLFHTTKQRSMSELMATKTNVNDDENGGNLIVGEGTIAEKETVTKKNKRKSTHSELKTATSDAEELNTPAKPTPASRTRKKIKDTAEYHSDASKEKILPAEAALTSGDTRKKKGSEVVKSDTADEINLIDVEVGDVNVSDKQKMGRRTRKKIQEAVIGNEHGVAKDSTPSDKQPLDSRKMVKINEFEVENGKGTVEEITRAGQQTRTPRKRKDNIDSELGNDGSEDPHSKTVKKTKQRAAMVKGENKASIVENSDISKQISPPEVSRKSRRTGPIVSGDDKASKVENDVVGESSIAKGGTKDDQLALTSKTPRKVKPTGLSVTIESKPFDVENDDLGSNERSKSSVSFRERKKSKYLSPPYTNTLFSPRDPKSEKPKFPSTSNEGAILVGCSGKNLTQSNVSGWSSPLLEKAVLKQRNVHGMLSDIRSAALDPLCLGNVQSDDVIKGFFTEFRGSAYHDEHESMFQNKIFVDSVKTKADSPSKDMHKTGFQMSEGETGSKKRKTEEDEKIKEQKKLKSPKLKSKHAGDTADVHMALNRNANVEKPVPVLLLTFVPGVSLPSKDELVATFSPCGALKESETKVIEDSCCAQVVFGKEADALEAYNKFENLTSFGSSVISYRLRYLLPASLGSGNAGNSHQHQSSVPSLVNGSDTSAFQSNSPLQVVEAPPLASIRQNIEMANSMLEKSWDKLSSEVKTSLDDEIRSLLDKVTSMVGAVSS